MWAPVPKRAHHWVAGLARQCRFALLRRSSPRSPGAVVSPGRQSERRPHQQHRDNDARKGGSCTIDHKTYSQYSATTRYRAEATKVPHARDRAGGNGAFQTGRIEPRKRRLINPGFALPFRRPERDAVTPALRCWHRCDPLLSAPYLCCRDKGFHPWLKRRGSQPCRQSSPETGTRRRAEAARPALARTVVPAIFFAGRPAQAPRAPVGTRSPCPADRPACAHDVGIGIDDLSAREKKFLARSPRFGV